MSPKRWALLAVVALAGVAAVVVWYLSRPEPAAVDLDRAVAGATSSTSQTTESTSASSTGAPTVETADGEWIVDTETGDFSFSEATGSFAGFRIEENLTTVGATTAVGRSPAVAGRIVIEDATVTQAEFEVDLREIVTNASRRDRRVQEALETGTFPSATFVLSEPIPLGTPPELGDTITVEAPGQLTIHGETLPVVWPLQARWVEDDLIVVVGSLDVTFSDFGVAVPSAPIIVSVDDHGIVEVQLLLRRS